MSQIVCKGCNRYTITYLSKGTSEKEALECYVALENNHVVKGCGYERADTLYKKFADEYLKRIR